MAHTATTCTFCGVGCGLYLETSGNEIVGAYPSTSHPTNEGRICVRGWHVHEIASSPDRLRTPLLRKSDRLEEVGWDEALDFVARRLVEIRDRHGADALAFLNSPRCSNEETYLLQKLARAVVGTNNVDHGAGVYCNNSVDILLDMLGVPASTNSIAELDTSDVIVLDGVDLGRQLPTIAGRVIRAKLHGAKLIVIDARRHRVAEHADFFLQIKPGTEALLYAAMAKVIVDRGLVNLPFVKARCRGYEAFLNGLQVHDLLAAADDCGLPAEQIEVAAVAYAGARHAAILYSTGVEARDAASIQGIVNLALATGHVGKLGSGVYALTEHNNLQGVCDMGMIPDRLPGYGRVDDASSRAQLERAWAVHLPERPGLTARAVLGHSAAEHVKGLWLCRYDPVSTAFWGDPEESLRQRELVVVQHIFMTETADYADVVLPTTAFGEERVSFTSTDRRIQLAERAIEADPLRTPAWLQIAQVARRMGADWEYESASDVMDEIARVVPFYSGVTYDNLAREYGRQWPCTTDRPLGTQYLFADGRQERRFRFAPVTKPFADMVRSPEYPMTLVFGHSLYYWHQNVLIRHSETLKREYGILLLDYPEGFVEINTDDARELGIRDGARVRLCSEAACAVVAARVTPEVRSGAVFVPYFVRQVQAQIRIAADNGLHLLPVRVEKLAA